MDYEVACVVRDKLGLINWIQIRAGSRYRIEQMKELLMKKEDIYVAEKNGKNVRIMDVKDLYSISDCPQTKVNSLVNLFEQTLS